MKSTTSLLIMSMRVHAIVGLASILAPSALTAATFTTLCDNTLETTARACTIKLSGQIVPGDSERLRAVLLRRLPHGWRYGALLLDSPGGSVGAALEVADLARRALLDTTTYRVPSDALDKRRPGDRPVQIRWKCISACFLVWVAGADRSSFTYAISARDTSDIGLHRPYLEKSAYEATPERVAGLQQQVMQTTSEYLKREQIPQSLIEKMLQRASTQIYWVSEADADITGRAAWFEEMMISRCDYDPTYDRETSEWAASSTVANTRRQLESGRKKIERIELGPRYTAYISWRQRYNTCEYGVRQAAQEALRR